MLIKRTCEFIVITIKKIILKVKYKNKIIIGKKAYWRSNLNIRIEKNGKLILGNSCFFNNNCSITCQNYIKIGRNTIIGEDVKIYDHNHIFNKRQTIANQGFNTDKVIVGNNCWIGSNVILLKGTVIGDNCVVAAGSIISSVIPNNSIVKNNRNISIEKIKFRD